MTKNKTSEKPLLSALLISIFCSSVMAIATGSGVDLTPAQEAIALKGHHESFCGGGLEFLTDYEKDIAGLTNRGPAQTLRIVYEKKCRESMSQPELEALIKDTNQKCLRICLDLARQARVKRDTEFSNEECTNECGDFAFEARAELKAYLKSSNDMIKTNCGQLSPQNGLPVQNQQRTH